MTIELYDNSTHFLLELVQNADDNNFALLEPTLRLTYKPGSLRVDCNETGFTDENVKAICAIRKSTKSGLNYSKGYIGEKGIGFKSVFKVASQVWISSRHYRFKFDKREEFGLIAPKWAEFPELTLPNFTSFYLRLSEDYKAEELEQKLCSFDLTLLLFLRKLRNVELQITLPDGRECTKRMGRSDENENGEPITVLRSGLIKLQYLTIKHIVEALPHEVRRPNYSQSELVLAFPIKSFPSESQPVPQYVYAYLPVNDYGLKV